MNWQTILEGLWAALNSPLGIAAVAALALWLLNRLYASRPAWAKYEGSIISAVKLAEKEIPDDAPNKGLQRLDLALKYVLRIYEQVQGKAADPAATAALREGIQLKHAELEAEGIL